MNVVPAPECFQSRAIATPQIRASATANALPIGSASESLLFLLYFFDIGEHPGFIEERWEWAVKAEQYLKFLLGVRRDPIGLFACWGSWSEVYVDRAVRINL